MLVTSKHAFGPSNRHSEKGREWLGKHLKKAGKTSAEFSNYLRDNNLTAAFEVFPIINKFQLADDEFEEHVLEYPPETRGLYMHGLNENCVKFYSKPMSEVRKVAEEFGFFVVKSFTVDNIEDLRLKATDGQRTGCYDGKPVEGFVIRCNDNTSKDPQKSFFFKIKFEEPYLVLS